MHIHNGHIWTGDPARPWARSITINNSRVMALDEATPAKPTILLDAGDKTITPGLIDAHLHLLLGGQTLDRLDLGKVRSRREFQAAIARLHAELPPDQWLIARGWSQENWADHDLPDKSWLAAAGDRPTVCYRMDMHAVLVNDAVLRLCDLQNEPAGGRIQRDPVTGQPTGMMIEAAAWQIVNPLIPQPDAMARRIALLRAQRHVHALGLTAVGTMEYARDVNEVYLPLRDQLTLRCRATILDRAWPMEFEMGRDFPNGDTLAVIGYKAFIDGTLGSRTARMLADYADDPGNRGMLVELAKDGHLLEWARRVCDCGLSPSMHAIGDEAVRIALDVIDQIGISQRPRIEHAQQIDPADTPRFRDRIASMQPLHKADDCRYVERRLGKERISGAFAFRRLLNAGARLAFGSDWPVVSPDPMLGIRAAVTGLTHDGEVFGPDQNLTVEEALRAYTSGAAFALGWDDGGVLRAGSWGDLVMFDRDPFSADWMNSPPRVMMTVVGGRVVYDAGATRQIYGRSRFKIEATHTS